MLTFGVSEWLTSLFCEAMESLLDEMSGINPGTVQKTVCKLSQWQMAMELVIVSEVK